MGDWQRLQRKIFSRWCNQKMQPTGITVTDIVDEIGDGILLIKLLEVLSETEFTAKYNKKPKMRVHKIDNLNHALKFTWDSGVDLKVKPSAEDLADGDERRILGLVWALMLKFLKFGDDESSLNAKDALLLWVQQKTADYPNCKVDNFKKSFKDGIALCAIIHKHRPKLIPNMESLSPSNDLANIALAQDAAEKYFNLEKYITPEDVKKLDESSMVVYVSEYYQGIAEQRKVDLAVRRVAKLVKMQEVNDAMRKEFNENSVLLKDHLTAVEKILSDRTIDNTMAGAKKRIADFYVYKTKDKGEILGKQLAQESLYNNLAMRLAHHKRPEYVPPEGLALKDVANAVTHLEECEQERKVALHKELNRQLQLVSIDGQHKDKFEKLQKWVAEKEEYLNTKVTVTSVGAALFEISKLDTYDKESANIFATTVAAFKKVGDGLDSEKYENIDAVRAREQEIDEAFVRLGSLSEKKHPVADDDLAREQFRENLRLQDQEHNTSHAYIMSWVAEKEAYLNTKEDINSVTEAQVQLSLLSSYEAEKVLTANSNVAALNKLGEDIRTAKYETEYSSAACETTDAINAREQEVASKWESLTALSTEKKAVLDDDLAREQFKAKLRVWNTNHEEKYEQLQGWIATKEEYLNKKEDIQSVAEAQVQLSLLASYEEEKKATTVASLNTIKQLGEEILAAKYETKYSSASWETPDQINQRHQTLDEKWELLSQLSSKKKAILEDDLAREEFKEKLRRWNKDHASQNEKIQAWVAAKEAYLNVKENVTSVAEAETQLALLQSYEKDKVSQKETAVARLKKLGAEILAAKYETEYSSAKWETPDDITSREASVDEKWESLATQSAHKKAVLEDDLAREQFNDELRAWNHNHDSASSKLQAWIAEKEAYLNKKEEVDTVSEAQLQLKLLAAYETQKVMQTETNVQALKDLGKKLLDAKYETEYSSAKWEARDDVTGRESAIDDKWATLSQLSASKKQVLEDDLAREQKKEELRLAYANAAGSLQRWTKETCENVAASHFGFTLEEVEAYKATMEANDAEINSAASEKRAACDSVFNEGAELGVKDNVYTSVSLADLDNEKSGLDSTLEARRTKYAAELKTQQENDALCKSFAEVADPFSSWMTTQKDTITNSKEDLDAQLAFTNARIEAIESESAPLADINRIQSEIDGKGITTNRHTLLTAKDVEVQHAQYKLFLEKKQTMLAEAIEHNKLRGITPEQYKEIEENFANFDKNNDSKLDVRELKACLYSLGEERGTKAIAAIIKEYGGNVDEGGLTYAQFKEFMISLIGDSDTKEEIVKGLQLISRGGDVATDEHLDLVMGEHENDYFKNTAPKVEGGYNYSAWCDDMFSR